MAARACSAWNRGTFTTATASTPLCRIRLYPSRPENRRALVDAQPFAGLLGRLVEVIGHGMEFVAAVPPEQLGQPRSAAAAADQAELDLAGECLWVRLGRGRFVSPQGRRLAERRGHSSRQRTPQKETSRAERGHAISLPQGPSQETHAQAARYARVGRTFGLTALAYCECVAQKRQANPQPR